ncbi:MAG: dicarboxylate/amino acid:cation symporter, partial [Pseudohongiellaceae bacterium]
MATTLFRSLEQINPRNLRHAGAPLQRLIRTQLWLQILLAMVLGLTFGLLLNPDMGWVESDTAIAVSEWLALPGYLFLAFIQMIVIPLILASIVRGIAAATDVHQLKSTGLWVTVYFLGTTIIAVVIGIALGYILKPGTAIDAKLQSQDALPAATVLTIEATAQQAAADQRVMRLADIPGNVSGLLPTNPMNAIAEGQMLQIVIFAVVLGVGLLSIKPESAKPLIELFG